MNKKVLVGIGAILVAVIIAVVCVLGQNIKGSKELEITRKTNGGVPYEWQYTIKDESIVKLVEKKDITSDEDKNLEGGPVSINYIFKGLKKGKTTITFKYVNIVDGSVEKEETFTVKVDGNKNIALQGTN